MDPKPSDHYIATMRYAYQECAEWSSRLCTDDGGDSDAEFDSVDNNGWADDADAEALALCKEFAESNWADLGEVSAEQAGHDLWLTRNHHGAGFWDRGRGEAGRRLTDAAHACGGVYLWLDTEQRVRCE